ncbi:single-stranded DNA-binding protein [Microbacterium sp. M3]|uniref:Single-stranded DNA-binding protein n=1 Tax=Microbacterium arthrosphaerae TaxID=792652 RepID=A0ABU4H000_9MICO|nr:MULTISPECIES: single-stranded DNA-binding protein [Microbacterium]MDW4572657.1 single-stranded DNA-binding protein [Microbacterium arthrosphaerae]MDW7606512.1 single-stranded DNA-binding protein [Microbacterium sp. M3]
MTIQTQQSLSGFLASEPQLSFNAKGEARLWVRIGQEHFERNDDGTFTQLETTYHDLVMFRRNAERAYAMFNKGDAFIAEGYTHNSSRQRDGETVETEEFVAKRLGHDSARTNYTLQRRRMVPPLVPSTPSVAKPAVRPVSL